MSSSTDINTGLAGSLVMIILCTAVTVLLISFYRRYKRANKSASENSSSDN